MSLVDNVMLLGMAGGQGSQQSGASQTAFFMQIIFLVAILYFMLIRPQQRKEKERRKMIDELQSGDRIIFAGGLLGTVTNIKDDVFTVKIAENVKIEISKGAVTRVLQKDEKVSEAEQKK